MPRFPLARSCFQRSLAAEILEQRRLLAVTPLVQMEGGSVSGIVHRDDVVSDGQRQAGETPLVGVGVELLNVAGQVVAQTETDATGEYRFEGIWPGVYAIRDADSKVIALSKLEVQSGEELEDRNISELPLDAMAAAFVAEPGVEEHSPETSFPLVPVATTAATPRIFLQAHEGEEYFPSSVDGESQPWRLSVLKPPLAKAASKLMHPASVQANPLRSGRWLLASDKEESAFGSEGSTPLVGDFNGDGRDELAVFLDGEWSLDTNGNRRHDDEDTTMQLGNRADQPVVGDWDGDGDDDIGVYASQNATPVTGDFAGRGRDVVGLFRDGSWQLDANGDGQLTSSDATLSFGAAGDMPIVGDFDGDGRDEIGVFRNGQWIIDSNHNGQIDAADKVFELGGAGDLPVVGDFDGDGVDEPGLYRSAPAARISRTR